MKLKLCGNIKNYRGSSQLNYCFGDVGELSEKLACSINEKQPPTLIELTQHIKQGLADYNMQSTRGGKDIIQQLDDADSDWRKDIETILMKMNLSDPMKMIPIANFGVTDEKRLGNLFISTPTDFIAALNQGDVERALQILVASGDAFASWAAGLNLLTKDEIEALRQTIALAHKAVFSNDEESQELLAIALPIIANMLCPLAASSARVTNTNVTGIPIIESKLDVSDFYDDRSNLNVLSGSAVDTVKQWLSSGTKQLGETVSQITDWLIPDAAKDYIGMDTAAKKEAKQNLTDALKKISDAEISLERAGVTTNDQDNSANLQINSTNATDILEGAKKEALTLAAEIAATELAENNERLKQQENKIIRARLCQENCSKLEDSELYDIDQLRDFILYKLPDDNLIALKSDAARVFCIRELIQQYPTGCCFTKDNNCMFFQIAAMTLSSLFETGGHWDNSIITPQKGVFQIADVQIIQLRSDKLLSSAKITYDNSRNGWLSAINLIVAQMQFSERLINSRPIPTVVAAWLESTGVDKDSLVGKLVRLRWIYYMGWSLTAAKQESEKLMKSQFDIIKHNIDGGLALKPTKIMSLSQVT